MTVSQEGASTGKWVITFPIAQTINAKDNKFYVSSQDYTSPLVTDMMLFGTGKLNTDGTQLAITPLKDAFNGGSGLTQALTTGVLNNKTSFTLVGMTPHQDLIKHQFSLIKEA